MDDEPQLDDRLLKRLVDTRSTLLFELADHSRIVVSFAHIRTAKAISAGRQLWFPNGIPQFIHPQ